MIELTMEQVRGMFARTVFDRGMEYYRQDRVRNVRYGTEKGLSKMECLVLGESVYRVTIQEQSGGRLLCSCGCFQFLYHDECKHLAAAMIHCANHPQDRIFSDWNAKSLLKTYMDRGTRILPERSDARLLPRLSDGYIQDHEYPRLSFRVGREKLYVVKNVANFLTDVHRRSTVMLGKNAELDHSIESFDDRSRKLIRILMNEQEEFRAIGSHRRESYGYSGYGQSKNEITLTGDAFDRFFRLFLDQDVETFSGGQIRFCEADPQVTITLHKGRKVAKLSVDAGADMHFFGHVGALYACDGKRLLRCSDAFRERISPLLELRHKEMELAYEDLPDFCSCVLPEIEGLVTVEDPKGLLDTYLPEECTPCFYFDMEDEVLSLQIRFRYGDREYPELPDKDEKLRRDSRTERQAAAFARGYFAVEDEGYVLAGEERVYDFLTESMERFRELGEVYISDRLRRKQIPAARASVGVSVSDGMLTLDLDTGEFPAGELEALYQSLLKKKKYHRLTDGRFLTLDGGSCEKLAEMAHMLQLTPKELDKGELKVPAFRALYLDSVLSGSEALDVTRDKQFRGMIRSFKSLSESDYAVPELLDVISGEGGSILEMSREELLALLD